MKTYFIPGHITGFFEVKENDNPLKSGSRGAGVVLDAGMDTGVIVKDSEESSVNIFYDREPCECKTTVRVVNEILNQTCGAFEVEVHHFPKLPEATGFAMSGSGALGCALALNNALDLDLDYTRLGEIAHLAEVENGTGLGDVSAQLSRGLVIRSRAGSPGKGRIKSIPLESYVVTFIIGKPLYTKKILEDTKSRAAINVVGEKCVSKILKNPTPQMFMELSQTFTRETGLAQKEVLKALKTLEEKGFTAGMCMLGNAVFTLTEDPHEAVAALDCRSLVLKPLEKDIRAMQVLN